MAFRILMVCTGNLCRSPLAERLFCASLPPGTDISVSSAGVGALVGYPIDPPSAQALRELGGDPDGHQARMLEQAMIDHADLVLTATREHRDQVLAMHPQAMRRTFTMKEFVRLARAIRAWTDLPDLVAAAAAARGLAQVAPGDDDIADPFRQSPAAARACAAQIHEVVRELAAVLTAGGAQPSGRSA